MRFRTRGSRVTSPNRGTGAAQAGESVKSHAFATANPFRYCARKRRLYYNPGNSPSGTSHHRLTGQLALPSASPIIAAPQIATIFHVFMRLSLPGRRSALKHEQIKSPQSENCERLLSADAHEVADVLEMHFTLHYLERRPFVYRLHGEYHYSNLMKTDN